MRCWLVYDPEPNWQPQPLSHVKNTCLKQCYFLYILIYDFIDTKKNLRKSEASIYDFFHNIYENIIKNSENSEQFIFGNHSENNIFTENIYIFGSQNTKIFACGGLYYSEINLEYCINYCMKMYVPKKSY